MLLLDVDGVIAGSHDAFIAKLRADGHDVTVEDITAWDFGRLREKTGYSTRQCVETFWSVWRDEPHSIKPLDADVVHVTNHILGTYRSEIVTANPVPTVEGWLARVGIRTDLLRTGVDQKTALEHTVLVEDNPTLELRGQVLLLRDQPWNRHVAAQRFYHSSELVPILSALETDGVVARR